MAINIVSGAAAAANVAAEPCNLILYGPPGIGKTTDAVSAFTRDGRCNAFFISCEDGALKPILARGLPVPDHAQAPVKTWDDLCEVMAYVAANRHLYSAVIIDTMTTWTANVYRQLEANKPKNKWEVPTQMRNMLYSIREGCRNLGLHVVYIAHEAAPYYDEERKQHVGKGGPALSPKTAFGLFQGVIDTILRVHTLQLGFGGSLQRVYSTGGPDWPKEAGARPSELDLWWAKNREGCASAIVPADLGTFLRGRVPPYAGL